MVALPTIILMAGILETSLLMFKESVLESATRAAAREVRTGQVQSSANATGTFKAAFCASLVAFPCTAFFFDVRTFPDFPQIAIPAPTVDQNGNPTNLAFAPGGPGTVVSVRVYTNHTFMTPLIGMMLGGSSQSLLISSTAIMKTEPFGG
jgi:Flp pilus assembly protein TadG